MRLFGTYLLNGLHEVSECYRGDTLGRARQTSHQFFDFRSTAKVFDEELKVGKVEVSSLLYIRSLSTVTSR